MGESSMSNTMSNNNEKIPLLDKGYIQLIETWGSDERIIESARMSVNRGFLRWDEGVCPTCGGYEVNPPCSSCDGVGRINGDSKLLARLWRLKHTTPFEMGGMTIEVMAPIMVYREWHRHRTQSYNEQSARYAPLPDINYLPSVERCMIGSDGKNKQAGSIKGSDTLTEMSVYEWLGKLAAIYEKCQEVYEDGLKRGIPKELARLCVPVARYSKMRASANLLNWLRFLKLRMDSAAQWEIRQYANLVAALLTIHFPRTMLLFTEDMVGVKL
jgi:thymidylate synthase (FAD)